MIVTLLTLIAGIADASSISARPLASTPPWTTAKKLRYVIEWTGESPQRLEIKSPDTDWRELMVEDGPSTVTPPLPPSSIIRVNGQTIWPIDAIWRPIDFARWSGPGLNGAQISGLAMNAGELAVAAGHGGASIWDGSSWDRVAATGLDALLPIRQVAYSNGRLVLGGRGAVAIRSETDEWSIIPVSGEVLRLLPSLDRLWINTTEGVFTFTENGLETALRSPHCQDLFYGFEGTIWAQCDSLLELPVQATIPGIEHQWTINDVELLPGGAWLAVDELGLVWWETSRMEHIDRIDGSAYQLTRVMQDLFVGVDGGLLHLYGPDERLYTVADGLPSNTIMSLIPGPSEKLWAGTDRGVALVNPHGIATPLPLASAPTDVPVFGIAANEQGVALASARGLVWLGMRLPKGWHSLSASVGPTVRGVLHTEAGWWAYNDRALFQLDRKGVLSRWPKDRSLDDIQRVAPYGEHLLIQEGESLRFWAPEALMLSPQQRIEDLHQVATSPDGSFWSATPDAVRQHFSGSSQVFPIEGVLDISPFHGGAWVATDTGLLRLTGDQTVTRLNDSSTQRVAEYQGNVWRLVDKGLLCGPTIEEERCFDLYQSEPEFEVYQLVADDLGVWVATSRGAYRFLNNTPQTSGDN